MLTDKEKIARIAEGKREEAERLARAIWEYAEVSFEEEKSCGVLIQALEKEGFTVEKGIAGIPTAFTATWQNGTGKPVVGLLAEYDALDGLSQKAGCPHREPVTENGNGHGCGHNLLGAGCYLAAVTLKTYMEENGVDGTVIYYGCPAEEGAGSKQFIARAGYFDKLDFAYTWHPFTVNEVSCYGNVAIMGANFRFEGIASHAGVSPHLGRSALDAVELMSVGANYLREHMIDGARVHYAYSDAGGTAPNVVQSHATVKYEVRTPHVAQVKELFERVVNIARGAALMTGTKMEYEVTMAFSDYQPNRTLAAEMYKALTDFGAAVWTEEDYALAKEFYQTNTAETLAMLREGLSEQYETAEALNAVLAKPLSSDIFPFNPKERRYRCGSTDVGDVGYVTPTVELSVACAALGTVGHSWQNTAQMGSQLGMKGMVRAGEILALATLRTMQNPGLLRAAREELLAKNGGKYVCPLPASVQPPIGKY